MKESPILFSDPMVKAILAGTKTQTRRVVKPKHLSYIDEHQGFREDCNAEVCPYGKPGDRLWIREAWRAHVTRDNQPPREIPSGGCLLYEADDDKSKFPWAGKYRPPMFMPRWASRILLEITAVRVERLNEISEADAKAEGLYQDQAGHWTTWSASDKHREHLNPIEAYRELWESINGPGSLAANPWVWVIEFRRAA